MVKKSNVFILSIVIILLQEVWSKKTVRRKPVTTPKPEPEELNFTEVIMANSQAPIYTDHCLLRITGGEDADINVIPYQVAMRRSMMSGFYWFTFCGGTIITLKFVLGAAHCYVIPEFDQFKDNIRAVAGSVKSEVNVYTLLVEHWRRVKYYYYHKEFAASVLRHDLALLELEEPFMETEKVKPIRMHSLVTKATMDSDTSCLVSGYGKIAENVRSKQLQMVCIPIIPHLNCSDFFGAAYITSDVFCAGSIYKDSCEGDSGGPIVCGGVLVGIVSWGLNRGLHPGVYTRIISYTRAEHVPFARIVSQEVVTIPPEDESSRLTPQPIVIVMLIFLHKIKFYHFYIVYQLLSQIFDGIIQLYEYV